MPAAGVLVIGSKTIKSALDASDYVAATFRPGQRLRHKSSGGVYVIGAKFGQAITG